MVKSVQKAATTKKTDDKTFTQLNTAAEKSLAAAYKYKKEARPHLISDDR